MNPKIVQILEIVVDFGIPLMEQGARASKNPYDDVAVAFVKGGLPEALKRLKELQPQTAQGN